MMVMRTTLIALPLLVYSGAIAADEVSKPYKGMWYPVGSPGSGFVLDQEADTLVITFFSYRDGKPVWYLAGGTLAEGRFQAQTSTFDGGSCMGCEHVPATEAAGPSVEISFRSQTTAWMAWDGGEPIAMRALAFDSPLLQTFGMESEHGTPSMYDLSGRWTFISKDKPVFPFDAEFRALSVLDPGGWSWGETFDSVGPGEDPWGFNCYSMGPDDDHPQCWTHTRGVNDWDQQPELSAFWGDVGPNRILGYTGDRIESGSEAIRGAGSGEAFRLTGPLIDSDTGTERTEAMDEKLPLYLEKGMWMEPGKPGSGITLDWQNNTLVATIFSYDEKGNPVWYQGFGSVADGAAEFNLLEFEGGSCFNCSYTEPSYHESGTEARIEFSSKSTAMLGFDNDMAFPVRSLAFDVPIYRAFPGSSEFGEQRLYDLRGKWLFVHHLGLKAFSKMVTFQEPTTYNNGKSLGWISDSGTYEFRCDDKVEYSGPQCRLLRNEGDDTVRLLSSYWADIGDQHIIGYGERPLREGAGITRGEEIIYGFRLSGPPE